jgi:hypothetical protein
VDKVLRNLSQKDSYIPRHKASVQEYLPLPLDDGSNPRNPSYRLCTGQMYAYYTAPKKLLATVMKFTPRFE